MANRAALTLARLDVYERRLAQLRTRPMSALSRGERAELQRIEAARDLTWRRLPARIAKLRATLAKLEAYAAAIGMGPV